jgi:hypothetical protein
MQITIKLNYSRKVSLTRQPHELRCAVINMASEKRSMDTHSSQGQRSVAAAAER